MKLDEFKKLLSDNGISVSVSETHLLERSEANEMEYTLDNCLTDVLDVVNEQNKLRQVYYKLHNQLTEFDEETETKWSFVQQFYNGYHIALVYVLSLLEEK